MTSNEKNTSEIILRRGQKFSRTIKSKQRLEKAHYVLTNAMNEPRKKLYNQISEAIVVTNPNLVDQKFHEELGIDIMDELSLIPEYSNYSFFQSRSELLEENRFSPSNNSISNNSFSFPFIRILKFKGRHWDKIGINIKGKLFVSPEEALFMFERGLIRLWYYIGSQNSELGKTYLEEEQEVRRENFEKDLKQKIEKRKKLVDQKTLTIDKEEINLNTLENIKINHHFNTDQNTSNQNNIENLMYINQDSSLVQELKTHCISIISIEEAFSYFINQNVWNLSFDNYIVYRYLKQSGYSIRRHNHSKYFDLESQLDENKKISTKLRNQYSLPSYYFNNLEDVRKFRDTEMDQKNISTNIYQDVNSLSNFDIDSLFKRNFELESFSSQKVLNLDSNLLPEFKKSINIFLNSKDESKEHFNDVTSNSLENCQHKINSKVYCPIKFDIWLPNEKITKNKISKPNCGVVVVPYESTVPKFDEIHLCNCSHNGVPIHFAIVENGIVSFLNLNSDFDFSDLQ